MQFVRLKSSVRFIFVEFQGFSRILSFQSPGCPKYQNGSSLVGRLVHFDGSRATIFWTLAISQDSTHFVRRLPTRLDRPKSGNFLLFCTTSYNLLPYLGTTYSQMGHGGYMVQKRGQIAIRDLYGAQPFEHSFRWEFLVALPPFSNQIRKTSNRS